MTRFEAQVIVALAHNQLSIIKAAQSLNYHRNNIYYHVKRVQNKTGLDPYDFFDMQKLYAEAMEVLSRV